MRSLMAAVGLFLSLCVSASAQNQTNTAGTTPTPVLVITGLTYQQLLPAAQSNNRHSITIQNNNSTDSCWITVGGANLAGNTTASSLTEGGVTLTAKQASIVLLPGSSYSRYYPYIPSDLILGTCTTTGDSIYVDTQ